MNKHANKAIAAILAAVLSLSLAACGDNSGDNSSDKPAETTAAAAGSEESKADAAATEPAESDAAATGADTTDSSENEEPPAELEEEDPPAEEEVKSPVLTEVGKVNDGSINFYKKTCPFTGDSDENVNCLNYMLKPISDEKVPLVERLDKVGVYAFCKVKDGMIYEGLMDAEGNVIIDADQGVGIYREMGSKRYIKAFFPEGETTDEKEAIYFVTANQFSFMPTENDTLYKGTVKIFDLETKKFLENTACKYEANYTDNGDIISFYDDSKNLTFVKADDTKLDIDSSTSITGKDFFLKYESGKNTLYDHDMKKIFSTEDSVFELTDSPYYYRLRSSESNLDGVMSAKGRTLIEPKYKSVYGLSANYLTYTNDTKYGLLKPDGTELTKDEYDFISMVSPGYFRAKRSSDGVSVLLDKTGKTIFEETDTDKLYALDENTPYIQKGDEYYYLVLSTGEFSLKVPSYGEYFGKGVLYIYDRENPAIYDVVTGEKLLDGFEHAYTAYGYVYVQTGDEITIYKVD